MQHARTCAENTVSTKLHATPKALLRLNPHCIHTHQTPVRPHRQVPPHSLHVLIQPHGVPSLAPSLTMALHDRTTHPKQQTCTKHNQVQATCVAWSTAHHQWAPSHKWCPIEMQSGTRVPMSSAPPPLVSAHAQFSLKSARSAHTVHAGLSTAAMDAPTSVHASMCHHHAQCVWWGSLLCDQSHSHNFATWCARWVGVGISNQTHHLHPLPLDACGVVFIHACALASRFSAGGATSSWLC